MNPVCGVLCVCVGLRVGYGTMNPVCGVLCVCGVECVLRDDEPSVWCVVCVCVCVGGGECVKGR